MKDGGIFFLDPDDGPVESVRIDPAYWYDVEAAVAAATGREVPVRLTDGRLVPSSRLVPARGPADPGHPALRGRDAEGAAVFALAAHWSGLDPREIADRIRVSVFERPPQVPRRRPGVPRPGIADLGPVTLRVDVPLGFADFVEHVGREARTMVAGIASLAELVCGSGIGTLHWHMTGVGDVADFVHIDRNGRRHGVSVKNCRVPVVASTAIPDADPRSEVFALCCLDHESSVSGEAEARTAAARVADFVVRYGTDIFLWIEPTDDGPRCLAVRFRDIARTMVESCPCAVTFVPCGAEPVRAVLMRRSAEPVAIVTGRFERGRTAQITVGVPPRLLARLAARAAT